LHHIKYFYDPSDGSCNATVLTSDSLKAGIPCLTGDHGIEAIAYKETDAVSGEPIFLVGLQDSDKGVYEVTASGQSAATSCYDGGGMDLRGFSYDDANDILWYVADNANKFVGYKMDEGCEIASFDTPAGDITSEEGVTIDFLNKIVYIANDGKDGTSFVAMYDWDDNGVGTTCPPAPDCGDGICGLNEDCYSCSLDCPGRTGSNPSLRFCCVEGECSGEGCFSLSGDTCFGTGTTTTTTTTCSFTACDGGGTDRRLLNQ